MNGCVYFHSFIFMRTQIMFIDIWCFGAIYTMEIALKFRTEKSCIFMMFSFISQARK